jgi:hypothetical protein
MLRKNWLIFLAPTGKPIGYEYITKLEPTALVVGLRTSDQTDGFTRRKRKHKRIEPTDSPVGRNIILNRWIHPSEVKNSLL